MDSSQCDLVNNADLCARFRTCDVGWDWLFFLYLDMEAVRRKAGAGRVSGFRSAGGTIRPRAAGDWCEERSRFRVRPSRETTDARNAPRTCTLGQVKTIPSKGTFFAFKSFKIVSHNIKWVISRKCEPGIPGRIG